MKKIVIVCGLISGAISASIMGISMFMCSENPNWEGGMLVGYASMILAFSLIFVAIKSYRDKHNGGIITFGQGFMIGLYISLITSTIYVATWAIEYNFFLPDFMDKYCEHIIGEAQKSGTQAEISRAVERIKSSKEMYRNPFYFTMMTYVEILPVGIIISLIAAAILKKKPKADNNVVA